MPVNHEIIYGSLLERNVPPPDALKSVIRIQGEFRGQKSAFGISEEMLSKHILLVGGTGSGKTNLFYHMVKQLKAKMTADDVMLIFDSKGDFHKKFFSKGDVLIGNSAQYRKQSDKWNIYEEIIADGKDFISISQNTQEICKHNVNHDAFIVTNGYYLSDAIIPGILETLGVQHFQITLDGPEDEYCQKKQASPDEYKTIIDNIFRLSNYAYEHNIKCQVDIRLNVDKTNYMLAKQLTEEMASDVRFEDNIFFYLGKLQGLECNGLELEEFESIQGDYEVFTKSRLQEILPSKCVWCDQQTLNNLCVGPEGELYKCERDFGDETRVVGSIFSGLNYSNYMLRFFDPQLSEKCSDCKLYPVCLGGCPATILQQGHECIATMQRAIELVKREFNL